jgi:hypothetical protein
MSFFKTLFILWGISAAGNIIKAQKSIDLDEAEFKKIDELCVIEEQMTLRENAIIAECDDWSVRCKGMIAELEAFAATLPKE